MLGSHKSTGKGSTFVGNSGKPSSWELSLLLQAMYTKTGSLPSLRQKTFKEPRVIVAGIIVYHLFLRWILGYTGNVVAGIVSDAPALRGSRRLETGDK